MKSTLIMVASSALLLLSAVASASDIGSSGSIATANANRYPGGGSYYRPVAGSHPLTSNTSANTAKYNVTTQRATTSTRPVQVIKVLKQ
jgi:hypothetical protein